MLKALLERLLALCGLVALAACASGEMGKSDSAGAPAGPRMVYPGGVLTTTDALRQTHGIYAVQAGGSEICCWLDQDVRFAVRVPPSGRSLEVNVSFPALPVFAGKKQLMSEVDSKGKVVATRSVPYGSVTRVAFPLHHPGASAAVLPVHLRLSTSVVPHDAGSGPDVRRLSVIMTDANVR